MKYLLLFLLPLTLTAQQPRPATTPTASPTPTPTAAPLWRCTLPGGTYEVALRAITAVSSHEYSVEGGLRVTEVNIATNGSLLARFYYLEPALSAPTGLGAATLEKAQALLSEGASKTGNEPPWKKVVKSYPTSTHAHTVEYRLESKDQVKALFESVETAFRMQRPGVYGAQ